MSQGRKERTPAQLDVLAQAREKAKIVDAERANLNAQAKKEKLKRNLCRRRLLLQKKILLLKVKKVKNLV